MDFKNFTDKAAEAIQNSMQLAGRLSHQAISPWHFLQSLATQKEGLVPRILQRLEIPSDSVMEKTEKALAVKA